MENEREEDEMADFIDDESIDSWASESESDKKKSKKKSSSKKSKDKDKNEDEDAVADVDEVNLDDSKALSEKEGKE